jgi:hypothetical protein
VIVHRQMVAARVRVLRLMRGLALLPFCLVLGLAGSLMLQCSSFGKKR